MSPSKWKPITRLFISSTQRSESCAHCSIPEANEVGEEAGEERRIDRSDTAVRSFAHVP